MGHEADGGGEEGEEAGEGRPHPPGPGGLVLQVVVAQPRQVLHVRQDGFQGTHGQGQPVQHPVNKNKKNFFRLQLIKILTKRSI